MNIYDENRYVLKTELKQRFDEYNPKHYYCKNNICLEMEGYDKKYFLEFPENNKIKRYILNTCIYDDKLDKVIDCNNIESTYHGETNRTIYVDLSCKNDSECFYNKCLNNYCVFNEDPSATHCDFVHKGFAIFQFTNLRCGKAYYDICDHDSECSSDKCYDKRCGYSYYVTSESNSMTPKVETAILEMVMFPLLVIGFSCCVCYIYNYKNKHKQKIDKPEKLENNTSNKL